MPIAPLAGDLEMYYDDDNFTDPWRDPETVETIVLHHGNAKNGRLWYAWPPLLARQYRVIRVDMRGFGRSTVPEPGYDWSLEGFAGDLHNLLDYLELDRVHLIGETIGGTIALQFAYQYPERLHTVTTCTSPYNFTGVDTYQNYYRLVAEEGVEGWARATGGRRVSADAAPEHHEWYIQQMGQTARHVVLETLAYLGTQNLSGEVAHDPNAGVGDGRRVERGRHPRPGARAGGDDAQLPVGAGARGRRLCPALGAGKVRAGLAGVRGHGARASVIV